MAITKRISYNAKINLKFNYNNNFMEIDPIKISYLMIESDYENNVIPVIYISLVANDSEYKLINKYKESGTFDLTIKKYTLNTNSSIEKTILSDTFNYIPSTSSANMREQINASSNIDGSYRKILIGLVSTSLVNIMRRSFNGIYKNIDQATLISLALEGTNPIIENLVYNQNYKSILIPPVSTRYQMIKFIFEKTPFYDTNFRFFTDQYHTYLLSKRGDYITTREGDPNNVIIDIANITSNEAMYQGFSIIDNAYYININPVNVAIIKDESQEKIVNEITVFDEDNGNTTVDIDYNNYSSLVTKKTYIRSNSTGLIKNELELGKSVIEIIKEHMDGSVLTPNKCYTVKNFAENSLFNGKYLLSYKREFFKSNLSDFTMSVNLGLKKIGKINPIGTPSKSDGKSYAVVSNKALSKTATKTTTATKISKKPL